MARMHSRKKGKSGSKAPLRKTKPSWVGYKAKELEMIIAKLAKEGKTPSKIGLILRDAYGIPDIKLVTKKSITKIMEEKKLLPQIPEDLMALIRKKILITKHFEANKHDMPSKRGLQLTDSKMLRLIKYYKNSGRLPKDWSYDPEKIRLLVE
ncbi:30S ribosomal protein S15 [Candidatus Woesearchaeota archaeon]|nr:30S ribosomal protein S15 [Candidatus Woesearchaeota archaeon]